LIGFLFSAGIFPRISSIMRNGVTVMDSIAANNMLNDLV